jgi:myo-inositol-1(or 4)-monophosphatase
MAPRDDLERIAAALAAARKVLDGIHRATMRVGSKEGGDPVTEADTALDACLRAALPRPGEGWLSEETVDDPSRLAVSRVWVVDPLDGTKEFVAGVPEWAISVGLVEDGEAVAGGVCNPAAGVTVVGGVGLGVRVEGMQARPLQGEGLARARVLASRSEVKRGEWARFAGAPFEIIPVGSVAWKLALVAAGEGLTFTLSPKHEWDVAGGVALVRAAGGVVFGLDGTPPRFNRAVPRLPGLAACAPGQEEPLRALLGIPDRR